LAGAYIGTSGWNYKHWRGQIYQQPLPQRRWLEWFAPQFDTVEINTSFYAIPKPASVQAWAAATPPRFRFTFKLWRGITHYRKLLNSGDLTTRFLDSVNAMPPDKRGPVLIQLPPNQTKDVAKLRNYIREFRHLASSSWRLAVEFRHASWLDEEVRRMLDGEHVALCIHDMIGRGETSEPNDAPFVYVRRHGSSGARYAGTYSPEDLGRDAGRVVEWVKSGRDVYVYYNNDIGGHAFFNALDLRSAVSSHLL
jgi:uncharacterized protein YecE (DUF72 family)